MERPRLCPRPSPADISGAGTEGWGQGFGYSAYPQMIKYHKSFVTEGRNCMATKSERLIVNATGKEPSQGFDWFLNQSFVDFTTCGGKEWPSRFPQDLRPAQQGHSAGPPGSTTLPVVHRCQGGTKALPQAGRRGRSPGARRAGGCWTSWRLAGATSIWVWVSQGVGCLEGWFGALPGTRWAWFVRKGDWSPIRNVLIP